MDEQKVYLRCKIGKARDTIVEQISIHKLLAFVDKFFAKANAQSHRSRTQVLPLGHRRVDGQTHVANRHQPIKTKPAGFRVHGNFDACAADLPEHRKPVQIAGLPQVGPADDTAIGQPKKIPQHILPAHMLVLERNAAALDDKVFRLRL